MKRFFILTLLCVFALSDLAALGELPDIQSKMITAEEPAPIEPGFVQASSFYDVYDNAPIVVRNNPYFMESLRSANNAHLAFEEGLYDDSVRYSQDAIRFAILSDEFVENALLKKAATDTIVIAKQRMDWASSSAVNARVRFPSEYAIAETSLLTAENFWRAESWENSRAFANAVIDALAYVTEISGSGFTGRDLPE